MPAHPLTHRDQNLKVDRIYAGSYPCEEQDGFVWVYIPDPSPQGAGFAKPEEAPEPAPQIEKFEETPGETSSGKYKLAYLTADMPVSIDHGIIGLMDPAHAPSCTRPGGGAAAIASMRNKRISNPSHGFRMSAHTPSSNSAPYKLLRLYAAADSITTTIDFVLPNLRREIIRAGKYWFSSLTTVTPITRISAASTCRGLESFPLAALWSRIAKIRLRQIRRTGSPHHGTAGEGLEHNPHLMLIDDADRPAKWYFQLKAAHLEAKRTGTE